MTVVGPALLFVLLFAPAARLLGLAYRSHRTPEIWAGLYFLGTAIGIPLRVLGHSLMTTDPVLSTQLNFIGHVFFGTATCAMTVFTWRVFRPAETWARNLTIALLLAIFGTSAFTLGVDGAAHEESIPVLLTNFSRLVPLGWAFFESFRYWRAMRKREALGLADPVVTNRFFLWSLWTSAMAILPATALLFRIIGRIALVLGAGVSGVDGVESIVRANVNAVIQIVFLLTAPVGAIALSLSFFPPARYVSFIERRAAQAPGAGSRALG